MSVSLLTAVCLLHRPDQADRWLRFGRPVATRRRGRHGIALFAPGAIWGYVDWRAGDFGTVHWSLAVLRAGGPSDSLRTWPGIRPGAELLLAARGKAAVSRVFAVVDAIEAAEVDPADVDPDYWRSVANRIAAGTTPAAFDLVAHQAAHARRAVLA